MFLRGHRNAHPKVFNLREIQFGRYAQHHVQELRGRQGSIQLPYHAHYALVTQVFKRKIDQVEVYPLQVHTGSGNDFAALGAGITEPAHGAICRKAIELLYGLHFSNIRETFCHCKCYLCKDSNYLLSLFHPHLVYE